MEWFTERPGGLPRYFSDYLGAWIDSGEEAQALVGVKNHAFLDSLPSYVRGISLHGHEVTAVRSSWKNAILDHLSHDSFDVWNPHFAYYAWGAIHDKRSLHAPIVCHFHGPWAYESKVGKKGMKSRFRFTLQKAIEKRVYRSSDRFIVLSDAFRQILVNDYGVPLGNIHVVPGAVDVSRFQPTANKDEVRYSLALPQDRIIVIAVRRLVRRMGLENLIQAIEALVADFPKLLLLIVGTGELEAELREMIRERNLQPHVWMTGRVADEHLPRYYQSADLSIVPSVSLEGFGLITTESLACGTPVLGTPVGGTKEVLTGFDKRLLFHGTEVPNLIEGIGNALSGIPSLPSSEECRRYVLQNHTWDTVIPKIRKVFLTAMAD